MMQAGRGLSANRRSEEGSFLIGGGTARFVGRGDVQDHRSKAGANIEQCWTGRTSRLIGPNPKSVRAQDDALAGSFVHLEYLLVQGCSGRPSSPQCRPVSAQ